MGRRSPSARVANAIGAAVLAVLSLVSADCRAESVTPPLLPVRVANLSIGIASMPQAMAIDKGVFARHGIDLQVINFIKGGAEAAA